MAPQLESRTRSKVRSPFLGPVIGISIGTLLAYVFQMPLPWLAELFLGGIIGGALGNELEYQAIKKSIEDGSRGYESKKTENRGEVATRDTISGSDFVDMIYLVQSQEGEVITFSYNAINVLNGDRKPGSNLIKVEHLPIPVRNEIIDESTGSSGSILMTKSEIGDNLIEEDVPL